MPANRLAHETSPYLLQHAHNPVDWHPWGPEAFARARAEDKPIFLSVGYSTCYWCHVMERQSFENPAVAEVMNRLFVNIKVDREERPDVDQLYMTGVQVQTHHGGWPMSVFLTPDLQYFYGGTYFPPQDSHGRPGFVTLLHAIHDAWVNRREEVVGSARQFSQILRRLARPPAPGGPTTVDAGSMADLIRRSIDDFDARNGGYGTQPKFPQETLLQLLLDATAEDSPVLSELGSLRQEIQRQLRGTLDGLMYGGVRDQLGGGFHRYSTDARWLVPHFEIMLYDNAMLGRIFAEASVRLNEPRYASVAREVFEFVLRELTSPEGAFYTALDAEVDAQEGLSYLWTRAEAERMLHSAGAEDAGDGFGPDDIALFSRVFGLDAGPNFADPHHGSGRAEQNVLFVADRQAFEANRPLLRRMCDHLLQQRSRRKQPLLDTKVITSWNALMIGALADAGRVLDEQRFVAAAQKAAGYLLSRHVGLDGSLARTSRNGVARHAGFLDDYAFLADACLSVHHATQASGWLDRAKALTGELRKRFEDGAGAFFFTDSAAEELPIRQQVATDSPLPSGNAVAAGVLARLGDPDAATNVIAAFAGQLDDFGRGMSSLASAAIQVLRGRPAIVASADLDPRAVSTDASVVTATAARRGEAIVVEVHVGDGWHVHANPPGAGLVATRVIPPAELAGLITAVEYPPGTPFRTDFADEEIPVYSGSLQIVVRGRTGVTWPDQMRLTVEYQACDDRSCQAPARIIVPVI